ncbi:Sesquiterpene synthase 2 [Cladobotryum mycophilum]|uniref:Terpene synthase n=1 Tax=Cladobotryum mycophilum TaxID=491253 RepID=A0ABR0SI51_9HYPO
MFDPSCCPSGTIILPDLMSYLPYPLRRNPNGKAAGKASEVWILSYVDFDERKRNAFLGIKAGELGAFCYPDALEDRLKMCGDFTNFLFIFDDWSDEFKAGDVIGMQTCVMEALRDPLGYQTDKKVGLLTKDYFSRFVSAGGPGRIRRFINNMDLYLQAVHHQALDRANRNIPDLESYIVLRRNTSACKPSFALIEYVGNIDMPDEVMDHPYMKILEDACNDCVSWSNDIYSYNVEQTKGDTHNMLVVLMHEKSMILQEAADYVGDLCCRSVDTFEETRKMFPSYGPAVDRQIEIYIDGLQNWMIGAMYWTL